MEGEDSGQLPFPAESVVRLLLDWYAGSGRDLPWRHTRDPYAIWLSEVMLQQTGVETVIPYYRRFLERYPTVFELAGAPLEEIIELWAGLGYYRRARNLHAAAQQVVREHGGRFPATLTGLQGLPGVGRSTAGAILSIAFDIPAPILDGNVRRVLCRLFALQGDPRARSAEKKLWSWAAALTAQQRPHDYAQAIMDLGATLCMPRHPACGVCPLADLCLAHRQGVAALLPEARPRKQIPLRHQVALVLEHDGRVLVRRRGLDGMLGGLWEFPTRELLEGQVAQEVARELAIEHAAAVPCLTGKVRHVYSHFRLEVQLFMTKLPAGRGPIAESDDCKWVLYGDLAGLALHGAHRKAFDLLTSTKEQE